MALAARKPQVSSPIDSIQLYDDISIEDVSFLSHIRKLISINDELDLESISFSIGSASYFSFQDELDISNSLFHFHLVNIYMNTSIDIDVYQNFTEQLIQVQDSQQSDSGDSVGRLNNLELDLALLSTNPRFYKEFNYSGSTLNGYSLYSDQSKSELLMEILFTFSGDNLIQKTIHRIVDNLTLMVNFNYVDGNLVSQTRIIL